MSLAGISRRFISGAVVRRHVLSPLLLLLAACAGAPVADGDFYTVRSGDTLYSLGRAFGQNYHDIARWNKLSDKDDIQVGQVLRVKPPGKTSRATAARTAPAAKIQERKASAAADKAAPASSSAVIEPLNWTWPARGKASAAADRNQKGIVIGGVTGQPVWAAEAGKVTYAGHGIRGYGNMVIVKHTGSLLSVYAHNKTILVKEGQSVTRGQQIAEMGDSDSSTVRLYFEIRHNGKPVNPLPLLPQAAN